MERVVKIGLHVDDKDNVATIFANDVTRGESVEIRHKNGTSECVEMLSDVPFGHKIAVTDIKTGTPIVKYGEKIGIADTEIKRGDYVHIHNMKAARGRGDLEEKK